MNGTQIFKSNEFGAIRTISNEQGEPLFCAKDVAAALGFSDVRKALQRHVDSNDLSKHDTVDTLGRRNFASFVNKAGLYALILATKRRRNALLFKRWTAWIVWWYAEISFKNHK